MSFKIDLFIFCFRLVFSPFAKLNFDLEEKMGKTKMSAGAKSSWTTAVYKVKKLTPRRIKMISEFLTTTIDFPDNFRGYYGSGAWMDKLIDYLREPKRCKSTYMDILAWLKDGCFEEVSEKIYFKCFKNNICILIKLFIFCLQF